MRPKSDKPNAFHLPANIVLKKELGRFNAMVHCQETMLLTFLDEQELSNTSKELFLKERARKYNIPLSHIPFENTLSRLHQTYLIYPLACFENFLDSFVDDMKYLVDPTYNLGSSTKGTKLTRVIDSLKQKGVDLTLDPVYANAYDYYRLCRNKLAHNLDNSDATITAAYNKIDKAKFLSFVPQWQKALSAPLRIEHDDLVAFSALVERIADSMVQTLYQKMRWVNISPANDKGWETQLAKAKAKQDKKETMQKYALHRYGAAIPDDEIEDFIKKFFP